MALDAMLIQKQIDELKIPYTSVAILAGISNSQLSDWLHGTRPLSNERIQRIREALTAVEGVTQWCAPIVPDLRNPALVKMWITLWEEKSLPAKIDELPEDSFVVTVEKLQQFAQRIKEFEFESESGQEIEAVDQGLDGQDSSK